MAASGNKLVSVDPEELRFQFDELKLAGLQQNINVNDVLDIFEVRFCITSGNSVEYGPHLRRILHLMGDF
ncbi:hypothetical protein Tco_1421232 [Tanacetum coccineum]